ncbi:HNH endonuclease signature motif containing protein [Agrococcus sp. SGAir0287]|uniref:HNH endonuclease signature motif containing protein n=1 Tax=Agrococcus sp. SGAir0287 TaxID=2070347 RepID=UPI0010CD4E90|nr:HNH endonuclease signature motif containing protein [Agrococcus sp. SGAir0287]QCR19122.1 hypothetical protein C1N71_06435 [Agrococcus sp. SGAir0287]
MRAQGEVETAVVDALVTGDLTASSLVDAEVLVAIDELAARRRRIDAAIVALAGEAAARSEGRPAEESLVRRAGHRSTPELLQHRIGVRAREARILCEVADATRAGVALSGGDVPVPFPAVAAAVAAGWIAVPQAHAIVERLRASSARVDVESLHLAERDLVDRATGGHDDDEAAMVPEHLGVLARRWLAHLDPDGDEPRLADQLEQRLLRLRTLADGSIDGRFRCTAEQGERIITALDAHVRPRRVSFDDPATDAAEASEEASDARTLDQRRMDALVAMVSRHAELASPRVAGEAPTLTIAVHEDALHGRPRTPDDGPIAVRSGEAMPTAAAARILCDGFVQALVLDDRGEPLRQGRRQRLFTLAQRRAIVARDRHCRAPGCTAPPGWCETHHVTRWADGGRTDVEDGILLCQHHHTEVHRGALRVEPGEPPAAAGPPTPGTRQTGRRWRVRSTLPRRPRSRVPLRT